MYAYDELDRTLLNERVSEFRDQVNRRLSGELTEDEFKMLRLQNGVYLQLHAYMFRVAIPYGTLSSKQLRALAHAARRYDLIATAGTIAPMVTRTLLKKYKAIWLSMTVL